MDDPVALLAVEDCAIVLDNAVVVANALDVPTPLTTEGAAVVFNEDVMLNGIVVLDIEVLDIPVLLAVKDGATVPDVVVFVAEA